MKCNNLIWIVYIKSKLKTAEGDNFFAEYCYGADGFRSGKKVNGVSTGYVYDGMYIVGESVDGVNYTYSRGTDLLGYTSSLGETVYYRTNVHGDVKELVNVFGESLERYDYNAYGAEDEDYNPFRRMFGKKSVHNPFRYTGEYTDSETGLVYLRNRMYDPETGRFTTEDPAKSGVNWYAYCEGNPITKVDPWGLTISDEDIAAYHDGRMSESEWTLLNKADYMWENANVDDYNTKAIAHRMAYTARMSYSNAPDNFDYTFGTGKS